jgi:hypothetical protein
MWQMVLLSLNVDCLWARMVQHFRSILARRQSTLKEAIVIATLYTLITQNLLYHRVYKPVFFNFALGEPQPCTPTPSRVRQWPKMFCKCHCLRSLSHEL